jgi:hypothetical protein
MKVSIPALLTVTSVLAGCGGSNSNPQADAARSTTTGIPVRDGSGTPEVTAQASHPHGAVADCSTRSWADFGGAFTDSANLVVGPLAVVGAGGPTAAAVVKTHGGQKFPLLVRPGHIVTVQVPAGARGFAALGYGSLPQGEIRFRDGHNTVTFLACGTDEPSGSSADGPVTFWSGFVLARRRACIPLEVYVDDEPAPRRVGIELGRPC